MVGQICLLCLTGKFHKILQQLQSNLLAFLRVKLRGEHVVAPGYMADNISRILGCEMVAINQFGLSILIYRLGAAMRQMAQRPPRFDMK